MQVIIGLGSNLGDRLTHLRTARQAFSALPYTRLLASSSVYETPAWGAHEGSGAVPAYLNACLLLDYTAPVESLLGACWGIEASLGRLRATPSGNVASAYQNRCLDADILFADDYSVASSTLTVPHPRLALRAFALVPACEIWAHPKLLAWLKTPSVQADAAQLKLVHTDW